MRIGAGLLTAAALLWGLAACTEPSGPLPLPTDKEEPPLVEPARWEGRTAGGGFGTQLVVASGVVYTSAPFAGELWTLPDDSDASLNSEFGGRTFAGSGLAVDGAGQLLVGAPGAGDGWLRTGGGTLLAEGNGVGGEVAASSQGWVASTRSGWIAWDGSVQLLNRRPDALAMGAVGAIVAGSAWGETALWIGEMPVPRPNPLDEAGAAVARCEGSDTLFVGAPGEGTVYTVDSTGVWNILSSMGRGRYGASLVCGPTTSAGQSIVIGAPHDGTDHQGAVYIWYPSQSGSGGSEDLLVMGKAGEELGWSVAFDGQAVWAGAPGGGTSVGAVLRVPR